MISLYNRAILCLLAVLVGLVLSYNFYIGYQSFTVTPLVLSGDGPDYIQIAACFTKTTRFGHLTTDYLTIIKELNQGVFLLTDHEFSAYHTWRPPIWPLLLALIFGFFKFGLLAAHVIKFLFILIGGFLFFKVLKTLDVSYPLILLGTVLYLIHPALQIYSRTFLSEPLTYFMMTFLLYSIVLYDKRKKIMHLILMGVFSGLLVLTHPYYIFLPPLLIAAQGWWMTVSLKRLVVLVFCFFVVVSPWLYRNYALYDGAGLFLTTSTGAVLAKGWNNEVLSTHNNVDGDLADESLVLSPEDDKVFWSSNELGRSQLYAKRTLEFIWSNQGIIIPIAVKKLKSAFNPLRERSKPGILQSLNELHRIASLVCLLFLLCAKNRTIRSLVWALLLATIMITLLMYSGLRFRTGQVPIEILLIIWSLNLGFKKLRPSIQNALSLGQGEKR